MSEVRIKDSDLLSVSKPSRYIGGEINSVKKEWNETTLKIALVFPEPYELGMSHLGFQIVYSILNENPDVLCERVFLPWTDMQDLMKEKKIPLFSLESKRPLSDFDIIGFSLQYEMSFTNILSIFDLADIEPIAAKRKEGPFIIGGGPCAFNPEPLARFFDLFLIGEGEESLIDFVQDFKENKDDREALFNALTKKNGFYIPSYFIEALNQETGFIELKPKKTDYRRIKKAVLKNLDIKHLPVKPIVPYMKVTHDRVAVEIQRGCTKGCRFCQAGMIYRPTRQRKASEIIDYAKNAQKKTGYENLSFLSLNSSDHCSIKEIFEELSREYKGTSVSLSLPSTRIDKFSEDVMKEMLEMRKSGYTFAPEAGSERLRKAINKPIEDSVILKNIETIYKSGWNLIKLYFMIGLPTETLEDIKAIVTLAKTISKTARKISQRNRLNINISPFVPKPHTPYQWNPQETIEVLEEKIDLIKRNLKDRSISLKWHDPRISALEALISRGDRKLADLFIECHRRGARLDAWSDEFDFQIWLDSMKKVGIDLAKSINVKIDTNADLPWDFVDTGVTKEYLKEELAKTTSLNRTADCAFETCNDCGLCKADLQPRTDSTKERGKKSPTNKTGEPKIYSPRILTFEKLQESKFLSHLELIKVFERAIRRASIEVKISQGFHPIPVLRFKKALPIGLESEEEKILIWTDPNDKNHEIKDKLNRYLPDGISITTSHTVKENEIKREMSPNTMRIALDFEKNRAFGNEIKKSIDNFKEKASFCITKRTKKGTREIDLKNLVRSIDYNGNYVMVEIDETQNQTNPFVIIEGIVGKRVLPEENIYIKKLKELKNGNGTNYQCNEPGNENRKARKQSLNGHPSRT